MALIQHGTLNEIWIGPSGHVRPGDADLITTARREAEEEAGLTDLFLMEAAPFDLDIMAFPERKGQPDHLHYDARFLFSTTQDDFVRADAGIKDVAWVPLAEVPARMATGLGVSNSRIIRGLMARFG